MITKASVDRLRPHLGARYDPGVDPQAFVPREGTAELLCRAFGAETVLLVAFYQRHTGFATWARDPDVCPRTQELAREVADHLEAGTLTDPGGWTDLDAARKRRELERAVIEASIAWAEVLALPEGIQRQEGPLTKTWHDAVRELREYIAATGQQVEPTEEAES